MAIIAMLMSVRIMKLTRNPEKERKQSTALAGTMSETQDALTFMMFQHYNETDILKREQTCQPFTHEYVIFKGNYYYHYPYNVVVQDSSVKICNIYVKKKVMSYTRTECHRNKENYIDAWMNITMRSQQQQACA